MSLKKVAMGEEKIDIEACEAFRSAGQTRGIEIWRIEKFEPVKLHETDSGGTFNSGDAYIVLHTSGDKQRFSYDLHFWLGEDCTQDEAGSAALRTVELDELVLGGSAVQYREVQGHESKRFLSYFKAGIRYAAGGVEGGLKKVDPDKFEKRLFQIKGRKNIRIVQVECKASSLNQGDTFVLDNGRNIYVWIGPTSGKKERFGGVEFAKHLRDVEKGGKAHIHVIEEEWKTSEEFFKALGSRDKEIRAGSDMDDDDVIRKIDQDITLYEISELCEKNKDKIVPITAKPLLKSHLNSKHCYVLDVGCAGVYVWLGKFCPTQLKTKVWNSVNLFLEKRGYPRWVAVTKVIDGGETATFKQYFKGWVEDETKPTDTSAVKQTNVSKQDYSGASGINVAQLHERPGKAEDWMPDDGSGKTEIWRVSGNKLVPVPDRAKGVFFGGDCYIILYTYGSQTDEKYIIYYWQGRNSSVESRTSSAGQTVEIDNKLGGRGMQIRVVEYKEPKHFLKIFGGKLIVFSSGHISGYENPHSREGYDPKEVYMFQVCGDSEDSTRAIQVKSRCSSLNSNDLFVVFDASRTFVWLGKYCSEQEKDMARYMGQYMSKERTAPVIVAEGEEKDDFWNMLGEKEPYYNIKKLKQKCHEEFSPRLFQCSMSSGRFSVEEIVDFCQDDLDEGDVMLLDTYDEIFMWLGKTCHEFEKKEAAKTAQNYLMSDPNNRNQDNTLIIVVRQGFEPPQFTGCFLGWDTNKWSEGKTFKEICAELGQENAGVTLLDDEVKKYTTFYSLDVLQRKQPPEGVDPLKKEMYLAPAEFEEVFQMSKDDFIKLPEWKRTNLRKQHDLF